MTNIIDPRDFKQYEIKDLKIVNHDIPDKNGELQNTECVEYVVIGHNHEWPFWMSLVEFKKANGDVLKELFTEASL